MRSERRFRLPGDEDLVARAVNLNNRGLGESCGGGEAAAFSGSPVRRASAR
ncbi:MAG TPA: hypothetical protein HA263_09660 [Methanoregulaceae archaeon]|nr:hypothetical protein [Methanoregulaceae archaeon]